MAKADITVAVERAVHDALRKLAQAVWDKHGVFVHSVRFSWVDTSDPAEPKMIVKEVEVATLTKV